MATLILTTTGELANLDQMVTVRVQDDRDTHHKAYMVVGVGAGRTEAVLFDKGTEEEARAELLRIARIMNAQGHTIVDQGKGRIHHPASPAELAKTDKDGAPVDPGKIPEALNGE